MRFNTYEVCRENDGVLRSQQVGLMIQVIALGIAAVVGLLIYLMNNSLLALFVCWFIGGIIQLIITGKRFNVISENASWYMNITRFVGACIGCALACPLAFIIALIRLLITKGRIRKNNEALSRFESANSQ